MRKVEVENKTDYKWRNLTFEPVDADARVGSVGVGACGPVLTGVVHNALVHIDFAVLAGEVCRTLAVIAVDAVHAPTPVQAVVAGTVVNVVLTPVTLEACKEENRIKNFHLSIHLKG